MNPKNLFALIAGLLLTASFAQTEIEVWYSLSNNFGAPEFEAFAERFNAEHPDIEVDVVYSGGYTDTLRKAQAAVAAGNAPSLIMFEQTRGAGFVDADAVLPLEPFIENDPDFDLYDFFDPLLASCTIDDTLYCLPYNTSTPLVYYNADMFREAGLDPVDDFPETWDELLEVGPQLAERGAGGDLEQWAFGLATAPGWLFDAWLGQAGGRYLNDDGDEFVFNDEHGLEVLEFWQELIDAEAAVASGDQTPDFMGGRQAMMVASTATLESRFNDAEFDLMAAPMWCGDECYVPIGGANLYMMDTGSEEQQEAAWEFLTWITSDELGAEFAAATGYMAPRESSLETETLQTRFEELPEARITYDQMASHGHPRTLVPFWGDVHAQLTELTEKVLLDDQDAQASLDAAVFEANRLLDVYAQ